MPSTIAPALYYYRPSMDIFGYLNSPVLPTSPPWCAVRAHKAKFAILGEFTLPIPENSANERGGKNKKKQNLITQAKAYFKRIGRTFLCFWLWPSIHLSKPFIQYRYHGRSVTACLSAFCELTCMDALMSQAQGAKERPGAAWYRYWINGNPVSFTGRSCCGGFFSYFFSCRKKWLASGARPAIFQVK